MEDTQQSSTMQQGQEELEIDQETPQELDPDTTPDTPTSSFSPALALASEVINKPPTVHETMKTYCCPNCRHAFYKYKNYVISRRIWRCYYCKKDFKFPAVRMKNPAYMGRQKRNVPEKFIITPKQLLVKLAKESFDPYSLTRRRIRQHALVVFLFLTGARISEVVGVRNQFDGKKYDVEPLRKTQIEKTEMFGHKIWRVHNMPVLKRKFKIGQNLEGQDVKNYPLRTVSCLYEIEKPFIDYFDTWLKYVEEEGIIFKMTAAHAWSLSKEFNNSYSHYWRHARLTQLAKEYGFTDLQLQHFVGWQSTQMASKYTHLDDTSNVKAMIMGLKNLQSSRTLDNVRDREKATLAPKNAVVVEDEESETTSQEYIEPIEPDQESQESIEEPEEKDQIDQESSQENEKYPPEIPPEEDQPQENEQSFEENDQE